MTNYEWVISLPAEKLAKVINGKDDICKSYVGNTNDIILEWLLCERVDCQIIACIHYDKDKELCDICWCRARDKGGKNDQNYLR